MYILAPRFRLDLYKLIEPNRMRIISYVEDLTIEALAKMTRRWGLKCTCYYVTTPYYF